ncbi:MAG TPA: hypothetical protein VFV11_07980 [Solimonas sp.]|nr:hypothetical protein [Solimonas sp.]
MNDSTSPAVDLTQTLQAMADRLVQLDWQANLLHSRLMVAERLVAEVTNALSAEDQRRLIERVREQVRGDLAAARTRGLQGLVTHLEDRVANLDRNLGLVDTPPATGTH